LARSDGDTPTNVHFVFTEHLDMTKDPAFTDNLLYMLLEEPRR